MCSKGGLGWCNEMTEDMHNGGVISNEMVK